MFTVTEIIVFIISLIFLRLVIFIRKHHNFWKERGVSSPITTFFFGHVKDYILGKRHITVILNDAYKTFPDERYVGFYSIFKPFLIIRDPELIGNILIKDFSHFHDRVPVSTISYRLDHHVAVAGGNNWKLMRNKLNPIFSTIKLKSMFDLMVSFSNTLESFVKNYSISGKLMDAKEAMGKYTTDLIGSCMFNMQFNTLRDTNSKYWSISKKIVPNSTKAILLIIVRSVYPTLLSWFKISEVSSDVEEFFYNFLQQLLLLRENDNVQPNDLMQLMINTKYEEIFKTNDREKKDILFNDKVIASNMFLFYSSGYDSPSTTLSYCLYDLALYPEIQDRVRAEIMKVLEANNGTLTYDSLSDLVYMEMVLSETLRLHSPVGMFSRLCVKTYKIPGSSLVLQPGDNLIIPIYAIHNDEKNYPVPSKFDPERFSEENKSKIKPYTYLPFGLGPRYCIGTKFTLMEMKICLTTLLKKFKFSSCSKTEIPLEVNPKAIPLIFPPKNGVWLQVNEI